jgi:hypothetical protein
MGLKEMKTYLTQDISYLLQSECKLTSQEITEEKFWELAKTAISTHVIPQDSPAQILNFKFEADVASKTFLRQFFLIDFKPKPQMLKLPARMQVSRATQCIAAGRQITKNELREKAKKHPNYSIKVDNGGVDGATDIGETIPIDTLGKWLFGVPSYKGHIIVMEGSKTGEIYIPNEAPSEVVEMIQDCIK